MPVVDMILIALAGVAAGGINAIVGSGTLITFPTLVALGYPPITATMSNAVGLVAGGVSGTWGYRRELKGQGDRLRWQIPASLLGACVGAWLLLHLPEHVFTQVVPVLLIGALVLVIFGPRIQALGASRAEDGGPVDRSRVEGPDGRPDRRDVRRRRVRRVLHRGAGHPADRRDGGAAARVDAPDERGEEPAVAGGEHRCRGGLHDGRLRPDQLGGGGLIAVGSLIGGFLGAHYGRRLSPKVLRVAIVIVGLIGLYRLLTV